MTLPGLPCSASEKGGLPAPPYAGELPHGAVEPSRGQAWVLGAPQIPRPQPAPQG